MLPIDNGDLEPLRGPLGQTLTTLVLQHRIHETTEESTIPRTQLRRPSEGGPYSWRSFVPVGAIELGYVLNAFGRVVRWCCRAVAGPASAARRTAFNAVS